MNRMMSLEHSRFVHKFPDAYRFIIAAHLRFEHFNLKAKKKRNEWEEKRIVELERTPAVQDEDYQKYWTFRNRIVRTEIVRPKAWIWQKENEDEYRRSSLKSEKGSVKNG